MDAVEDMIVLVEKLRLKLFRRPGFEKMYKTVKTIADQLYSMVEEERNTQERKVYEAVRTWDDLIAANILFLEGKLKKTPYHFGPLDQETLPLVGKLVQIHQLGKIYTHEGQPGLCEKDIMLNDGKLYGVQQKNYLQAVIPAALAPILRACLDEHKDVAYEFEQPSTGERFTTLPYEHGHYKLTDEKVYDTPADEAKAKWKTYTAQVKESHINAIQHFEDYPEVVKLLRPAFWFVVAGLEWCKAPVEQILLDCIQSPAYQEALAKTRLTRTARATHSFHRRSPIRLRLRPKRT